MTTVRIATRGSALAMAQARWVQQALHRALPDVSTTIVEVTTTGDVDRSSPVAALTEVGAFVRSVQQAVLDGRADIAVHSSKDLPVAGPDELDVVYPVREAPWDVMVGRALADLPTGARVGTGSPRRQAQLRLLRPDLRIDEIRGNVDTRIAKIAAGEYDAVVLAEAGLNRLDSRAAVAQRLSIDEMVPAPGQGALAVETHRDGEWRDPVQLIDDLPTRTAVQAERLLLERTGAGCRAALGALATATDGRIEIVGFVEDAAGPRRASAAASTVEGVANALIEDLELDS